MKVFTSLGILFVLATGGCTTEITDLADGEEVVMRMVVTGGVAGVDYTFEIQNDGAVVGIRCGSVCDFLPGDTLSRLTPAQRQAVRAEVEASGLRDAGRPVDFGTECCDQFTYRVFYTSGQVVRSFTGSSETLPEPLRRLVRVLHLLYLDTPPLIVSQATGLDGFSRDPLEMLDARVDADVLAVDVTYGGGCGLHDVDAVAYTGWMESNPVRIGVAVTHDGRDDLCDALIRRTLLFDLVPLRDAYVAAYGGAGATVILDLQAGAGTSARQVTYSF